MIKKINDILAGLPMTIVGGLFLLASFILPRTGHPWGENFAWVTVVICGIPLLYLAIWRIIHNKGISKISSALLISVAMIAAILIGDLFAAGEVAFIMAIGAILEDMTTERAKKGLKNLISLAPQQGRRISGNQEEMIPVEKIRRNDRLRILPGEVIPADGTIISGETSVDQSIMTGESLPVDKAVGDEVFCGTMNRFGAIDIQASRVGEDTSLQKLIRMVEDAEKNQAPAQRIADKWASWLVPAAMMIAVVTYLVTKDIIRAVTILVVFCPCALVLATPTAIMAAIGQATKHGVIIKSGAALEQMSSVKTIAFDKTGTLTYGKLIVSDVVPSSDISSEKLLALAASAESLSEHPLGKAITAYTREKGISFEPASGFSMDAGKGIQAEIGAKKYYFGSEKYLKEKGIPLSAFAVKTLAEFRGQGKASVIVSDGKSILGLIGLSDTLRPEAEKMIRQLEAQGTQTILLTGDHQKAADYFAAKVGIQNIRAELLPEEKVNAIQQLKESGKICMVGDGVNDAPALKTADVGVAMGAMGSDIAVEAADIALMTEDLTRLPYLKWLSDTTVKTIKGAITLSMTINFIAIILSVTGILTPTSGALVHNAGSCFVVLLAALLYDRKYKEL